jgi:adenylate cyclase class 2
MKTEYEATFVGVDMAELRRTLTACGGKLARPEYLQRRTTFELPNREGDRDTWLRVRDEGDKVTLTLKSVDGKTISGQKEILVEVNNFDGTVELLTSIGCRHKASQESKRELWKLEETEIAIDTWPFLDPYIEVEGPSEERVKQVSEQLGLNYVDARFDTVNGIYKEKYGKVLEDLPPEILRAFTFDMPNPFI